MTDRVQTINGDMYCNGEISGKSLNIPNGTIVNADINASAAIDATKTEHQFVKDYAQASAGTPTSESRVIHTVHGASATIVAFVAGVVAVETGVNTCTVDLKKNGTTCLSAVITLDSTNTIRTVEAGTLAVTTAEDGDVFEVVIANSSSDATGVFCAMTIRELSA